MSDWELACLECDARHAARPADLVARLRDLGMLRREADPDMSLILSLLPAALPRLTCEACGAVGLTRAEVKSGWPEAVCCADCSQPLDPDRLELFPNARLCAACQQKADSGEDQEVVFCPRCGDHMRTVARSRGVTRYELHCPACGAKA